MHLVCIRANGNPREELRFYAQYYLQSTIPLHKLFTRLHQRLSDSEHFSPSLNTYCSAILGPPLWSSGRSSCLQIRRPGFDSGTTRKKRVVGLERGPLSLVSTTEELLDRKVAAPV
jgi:hypothetical protein